MIGLLLRRVLLVLALTFAVSAFGPAFAQDPATLKDYETFDTTASQIEDLVAKAQVNDERLSSMRAELVKWRSTFTAAQGANADQITTVKNQIAALGPVPAEGQTEDAMIAKRRVELTEALAKLQAPVLTATEATTRADSTIGAIDKLMRERHADKLLRLSPSALNPVNWPTAVSMFRWMGQWIWDETRWRFTRPMNVDQLRDNAPLIVVLLLAATLLLVRGGAWMRRLTAWLLTKTNMRGRNLISGFVSLGQVLLPVAGAILLWMALERASLFGPIILSLFEALPAVVPPTKWPPAEGEPFTVIGPLKVPSPVPVCCRTPTPLTLVVASMVIALALVTPPLTSTREAGVEPERMLMELVLPVPAEALLLN